MRLRVLAVSLTAVVTNGLLAAHDQFAAFAQSLPPIELPREVEKQHSQSLRKLQLEVFINNRPTNLIAEFKQQPDGKLLITPDQLRNAGIDPSRQAQRSDGLVEISKLLGVLFVVDESNQSIHFSAEFGSLSTHIIQARQSSNELSQIESSVGALVNYTLHATTGGVGMENMWAYEGVSGWFEGRAFSPLGVLSHSQIVSTSSHENYDSTRLDTTWSYSNPSTMITYRAGDVISGGLAWTRPVRLRGVQVRRNFGLRPDLVTMPLPDLSGSAAVPSTVDVFVNNARRFTQEVPPGPFAISDLPLVTGSGTARVVVRDALGREVVSETPFFASSDLLARGLSDFSVVSGFARRSYGVISNDYDDSLMAIGSVRYGLNDTLTVEGHAESGDRLFNGGAGAVFGIGRYGVGSLAGATSHYEGRSGHQIAGSVEAQLRDFHIYARAQRTFGDYLDIAAVTAEPLVPNRDIPNTAPPRSLEQVSLSMPLAFDPSTLNVSYTQLETVDSDRSRILSVSYNRSIGSRTSFFATAYQDFEHDGSFGVFVGVSMSFGNDIHASLGAVSHSEGATFTADLIKSSSTEIGSVGWRVRDTEGARTNRLASINYRAPIARFEAGVEQDKDAFRASAQVEGAVVYVGNSFFLSNRINDAFAIVDAGAADVKVEYENRPAGRTNRNGKLLLPDLRSYEANRITIDPTNLPVSATVSTTKETTVPAERSGTVVKFGIDMSSQSAIVTLRDESGEFLELGSSGKLASNSESFVVGYDGQAYITDLTARNSVVIDQPTRGRCQASFAFRPIEGEQVTIPDAMCVRIE